MSRRVDCIWYEYDQLSYHTSDTVRKDTLIVRGTPIVSGMVSVTGSFQGRYPTSLTHQSPLILPPVEYTLDCNLKMVDPINNLTLD